MSQNLFWPPFLNIIFFSNFISKCKCIHVLLLWAKFHWKIHLEKCFFLIIVTWLCIRFGHHFETEHFLMFFLLIYVFFNMYTDMVQVSYRNSYGKVFKVIVSPPPPPPPRAQTGVKRSLGTLSVWTQTTAGIVDFLSRMVLHFRASSWFPFLMFFRFPPCMACLKALWSWNMALRFVNALAKTSTKVFPSCFK